MLKGYCGTLAFFLGAVLFLILPPAAADEIALHDGRTIKGKVEECGDIYKLHLKYGTISIPAVKVKKILIDTGEELNRKQLKERERIAKEIEEVRKHSNWRNAYKEESKHFVFKYNVTPEIAKGYIDLLEGFYKDFCKELGVRLGPGLKRKKMEINIFRDKENYTQVGGVPGAAGHFNFVEEELFFYHDRNDPEFVQSVLLHEFTHLLTHLMKSKFCHPTWCNEGLAEYYGASKREGSKLVFGGMQEVFIVDVPLQVSPEEQRSRCLGIFVETLDLANRIEKFPAATFPSVVQHGVKSSLRYRSFAEKAYEASSEYMIGVCRPEA